MPVQGLTVEIPQNPSSSLETWLPHHAGSWSKKEWTNLALPSPMSPCAFSGSLRGWAEGTRRTEKGQYQ